MFSLWRVYPKFFLGWLLLPLVVIWNFSIWTVYAAKLQAAQVDENSNSVSQLTEPITLVKKLENLPQDGENITATKPSFSVELNENWNSTAQLSNQQTTTVTAVEQLDTISNSNRENFVHSFPYRLESKPILLAAPENFNPDLRLPPPKPSKPPEPPKPPEPTSDAPTQPALVLENIQTDYRDDFSNFRQHNQIIEPKFQFGLRNGEKITFKTGFNTFEQPKFETVTNIPLQFGWQGKTGKYNIQIAGGIDIFNRLPTSLNFNAQIDRPIFINLTPTNTLKSALFLAAVVEQGSYKSSAQTLEAQITAWRGGLNVFWQIEPKTTFFSLYRVGFFNDGNFEQQSFSRLEHKFGSFWIAANLFTWQFTSDRQEISGYFSPGIFIVYNGEIGWEEKIFSFLRCRLTTTLGRQFLNGNTTGGNSYQSRCIAQILPNIDLDFGYSFSNVRNLETGDSPYNNRSFTGQFKIKF
ncbi:hypothetical protein GXM_07713 [Nostoc sphaeroides CCNUC1]|uniref:Uncharacterized protein n=1 Tax=Nostoc sphaeroides CCNUC1 TaxID=2653204 RepID=A0A5P8WE98_9NOSO|nr:hypothetical protein GXM_07713 [Nostoc sphaeroides CCNUC1]